MRKITLGILAHVDGGKTTLSESVLYLTGKIRKLGRVDHKDAYLDNFQMERDRGITIFSKQAVFEYKDMEVTLLDTPGHVDFSTEMERTCLLYTSLQSQINPHFLNNTLEIINWRARIAGNNDVSKMIESLSVMMEATMNRNNAVSYTHLDVYKRQQERMYRTG